MARRVHLAIDLGAESGRVIAGLWNGKSLRLEKLIVSRTARCRWPARCAGTCCGSWPKFKTAWRWREKVRTQHCLGGRRHLGVDFALLSKSGELLGQPYHYRDARNRRHDGKGLQESVAPEIFAQTGLQFMQINTLYQLLALKAAHPDVLAAADCLLMMPDFIHWALCGARAGEFTIGSTSQCLTRSRATGRPGC